MIELADVMTPVGSRKRRGTTKAIPSRGRNVRITWAVVVMSLVVVVVGSVSLAGTSSRSHPPSTHHPGTTPRIPAGSLSDLALVAPGAAYVSQTSPSRIDVIDPVTGVVDEYPLETSGRVDDPWVVEGDVVVLIDDLPTESSLFVEGTAIAFRPERPTVPAWSLGPASDVIPSVTPGEVWILSSPTGTKGIPPGGGPEGQGCTIREETIAGRSLTPVYPFDCRRWVVAAVDGGLLSVPNVPSNDRTTYRPSTDISPSTDFELQVWDPDGGKVVRTVSDHASFVLRMSNQYVEWQDVEELNNTSVQITDVTTGATRTFEPEVPKGMVVEDTPFLAPDGPFVGYSLVTPKVANQLARSMHSSPCCVTPVESAEGRVIVDDFETGATVLDREAPVSSSGAEFTQDDSFLVTTTDDEHVAFIPVWSASAQVAIAGTPQPHMYSDAEDFVIITTR
jgi:hypothetical protein